MIPKSLMLESPPVQNRRTHLPEGVKTKKWDDRMEKVKKEQAIKKLQAELKDEKLAEIQRCAPFASAPPSPPRHRLFAFSYSPPILTSLPHVSHADAGRSPSSGKRPLRSGADSKKRRQRYALKPLVLVATWAAVLIASILPSPALRCVALRYVSLSWHPH